MLPVDPLLAAGIYLICWWMCLFVVLPIGVRGVGEDGPVPTGHDAGAPFAANLKRKALWATGLALLPWALTLTLIALDPWNVRG